MILTVDWVTGLKVLPNQLISIFFSKLPDKHSKSLKIPRWINGIWTLCTADTEKFFGHCVQLSNGKESWSLAEPVLAHKNPGTFCCLTWLKTTRTWPYSRSCWGILQFQDDGLKLVEGLPSSWLRLQNWSVKTEIYISDWANHKL